MIPNNIIFLPGSTGNQAPSSLRVAKKNSVPVIVRAVTISGCSVIVVDDDKFYKIYHDHKYEYKG